MEIINNEKYISSYRVPSGCAVFGIMDENGSLFSGSQIIDGIAMMHDRSNGLGGGFAAYGIYPDFADYWSFHLFHDTSLSKNESEEIIKKSFNVIYSEKIQTKNNIANPPLIYRYFLEIKEVHLKEVAQEEFVANFVISLNNLKMGSYVISSGKNMGIFKGVGYPEDIGEFYMLDNYKGYLWTSHGRFPTNSSGWWGGAHPFGLLDWSVVHNGEISSYGTNKRFVNNFGYSCTFSTDTEVITYLFDLLVRQHKIDIRIINLILSAPLWQEIEIMPDDVKELLKALRIVYGSALLNGPFSIIVGSKNYMYALNDRIKLRPLVAARKNSFLYISSEEASIRKVCPEPDLLWFPNGGEPVIGMLKNDKNIKVNNSFKGLEMIESFSG